MTVQADFTEVADLIDTLDGKAFTAAADSIGALDTTVKAVFRDAVVNAGEIRDSGELMAAVDYDPARTLSRRVFAQVRQAFFQEVGTSRHRPQPWLTPPAEFHTEDLVHALARIGAPW